MRNSLVKILLASFLAVAGCVKAPRRPVEVPPPPLPALNKTFGEIRFGGVSTLLLRYKGMVILVDPFLEPQGTKVSSDVERSKGMTPAEITRLTPPAFRYEELPLIDYVLLSDTQAHHFGPRAREIFRKDMKILASADGATGLKSLGFTQIKGIQTGQRVLLKKQSDFLFVMPLSTRNPVSGQVVNGYLLEFDNGRNVFISGETVDEDATRQFIYGLRDDGKEIHLAFVYGGGRKSADGGSLQTVDEESGARLISLLQPKIAYLVQTSGINGVGTDLKRLRLNLESELFEGDVAVLSPGDVVPF